MVQSSLILLLVVIVVFHVGGMVSVIVFVFKRCRNHVAGVNGCVTFVLSMLLLLWF